MTGHTPLEVRFECEGGFVSADEGRKADQLVARAQRELEEQSRYVGPARRDNPKPWRNKAERKAWKRAIGRRR